MRILATVSTRVSVVVPVFNGMPHLPQALESILRQTHTDLQIVISDGGSTDGSTQYLGAIADSRVTVIHFAGSGAAGNWTHATQAAEADFVKLVCQDDVLADDAIEHQLAQLIIHPDAVLVASPRDIVDAAGKVLWAERGTAGLAPGPIKGDSAIRACYLRGTNILGEPVCALFRTQAIKNQLPWRDANPLVLDLDMYARLAPGNLFVIDKQSAGAFRVSTSSWSTRLEQVQVQQFRTWQQAYAAAHPDGLGRMRRGQAMIGLHAQAALRKAAYRMLRLKGSFASHG